MAVINSRPKDYTMARLLRQVITGRLPASRLRVKTHDGRYIQVAKVVDLGNSVYDIIPITQ